MTWLLVYEQMLIFVKLQLSLAGLQSYAYMHSHTLARTTTHTRLGPGAVGASASMKIASLTSLLAWRWLTVENYYCSSPAELHSLPGMVDERECMNMIKEHRNKRKTGRNVY